MNEKTKPSEKLKVLFLLTQDLKSPSGLGRYFPIAKYLVKAGFSVTIAALHPNYDSLTQKQFIRDGVKVHYVSQMHVFKDENQTSYFGPLRLIWLSIKATWKLFKAAISRHYDIIFIGKPHPMNGVAGILAGRMRRSKIIVDCDDYEAASNHYTSKWQRGIVQLFEDGIPKFADIVTTNTHFTEQRLMGLGIKAKKIFYIPNGIDPERFLEPNPKEVNALSQKLNLNGKKVVAYIGSLSLSNHSVDLLLKAFAILSKSLESIQLLIVGGGSDRETLEQLSHELDIADQTHFVGRVSSDKVPIYYRLADVTIDPAIDNDATRGRCPLKMFESWAMGVPFVTADVGDRRSLAGLPYAIEICLPNNLEALSTSIKMILSDNIHAKELSLLGIERVKAYSWSEISQEFISIFQAF